MKTSLQTRSDSGPQSNLAFYAFTATPKARTLELFGDKGPDGKPEPFSLYSMRQAIEERFILDVLKNYVTYQELYQIVKKTPEDPEHDKSRSKRQIARFASLHEATVEQKVMIIIEHFREHVAGKIAGRAKAMVVTRSRLHAVRYQRAFERISIGKATSRSRAWWLFPEPLTTKESPTPNPG